MFGPRPINGSAPCLIQDPSDNRITRRIVCRRASPHIVKHLNCQCFGGFRVADESHEPREHDVVHSRVQRMQRELIAFGNRLNEPDPGVFRYKHLRIVGIKQIAEARRGFRLFHDHIMASWTLCDDSANT